MPYGKHHEIPLETLKNRFLAAIYQQDAQKARTAFLMILDAAQQSLPEPEETREKLLRQIQTAFLRFKHFLLSPQVGLTTPFQALKTLLADVVKFRCHAVYHVSYTDWQARADLMPWQMDLLFKNAITVQLTSGCSHFCRRCNEWALPGIRSHFSHDAAAQIIEQLLLQRNTDPALYGASDPLDWQDGAHTLADLLAPVESAACFSLLTKVPRAGQKVLQTLVHRNIALSVSVTDANRDRITALEKQTGIKLSKQHDSDDLLIPAGLDEDFTTVKSSITDAYGTEITPEGAFIIIPTFTCALHPMGHKKLPVTRKTMAFPVKKIGRQALLKDYFKPLEVVGETNTPFHLSGLLDVQVETLLLDNGSMDLSPPGMRNLKEYFTIFQESARVQRKQITRSIVQRLKKQFFPHGRYHNLTHEQQRLYRQKIGAHLDFCNKTIVEQSRTCAVSFFLQAARDFLADQEDKKTIIAHLIKPEADRLENRYGRKNRKTDIQHLLSHDINEFFDRFRFYVTALVFDRHTRAVTRFIQAHPAAYDPVADRFVKDKENMV
ncbi:MAG: hypothetical protein K9K40_01270 [Desulfotignum sp.]|nr:hypothetical protein [Desulfotignum sp.]MCF8125699.1 hypothetical protein [Desulfotignum sp.]